MRFSATSEPGSGGDALLVFVNPKPGVWRFRPFVRDFPALLPEDLGENVREPTKVHLEARGRSISTKDPEAQPTAMYKPTDRGQVLEVFVSSE